MVLAGDAAHCTYSRDDYKALEMRWVLTYLIVACNAFSGPGLTGGLLEATPLADVLIEIVERRVSDSGAEKPPRKYAEVRRDAFLNIVKSNVADEYAESVPVGSGGCGRDGPISEDASRVRCRWEAGSQKPGRVAG